MRVESVVFQSEGSPIVGDLYLPSDEAHPGPRPGIVLAQGYSVLRGMVLPEYAKRLADAGFAALVFDYRGFGDSGGAKWRLLPLEQVDDVRNAITYLTTRSEVDRERIGLWGASFGGAHAVYVGAIDARIKAVVGVVGFGAGDQMLSDSRSAEEREQLLATIASNRERRVLGLKEDLVSPTEILNSRQVTDAIAAVASDFPELACELSWESAEKTLEYRPIDVVEQVSPRPLLIIAAEQDDVCKIERLRELYDRAGEPKEFVSLDVTHYGMHLDRPFEQSADHSVRFFERALGS